MRLRLVFLICAVCLATGVAAAEDPLDEAKSFLELGKKLVAQGTDDDDNGKIREGLEKLREAKKRFERARREPRLTEAQRNRIRVYLLDVDARIDWYAPAKSGGVTSKKDDPAATEVPLPKKKRGERLGLWSKRVRKAYDAAEAVAGRAALARGMASGAGVLALPELFDLFRKEADPDARDGVHEALAMVGTYRVANEMSRYAVPSKEAQWDHALDVIYRCLEKPDKQEKEKPFMSAIRDFHRMKNYDLSLEILRHLDKMGTPGIAALGEVIYIDDFGHHERTIRMLSKKRDRRAVPPLCYKMNRFKFEYRVQMPAHRALLEMGWYAVPELIDRLDDKAAGIWISWTLRKISGEAMGTDKRKWHDWWKTERLRHPEIFEDPDEKRAPQVTGKPREGRK